METSARPGCAPSSRGALLRQLSLIGLLWLAGEAVVRIVRLPLPGGLAGLALTLLLFASGRLPVAWLDRGAEWLLGRMLVFFVPATLAVLEHRELLGLLGLKILLVIVASTLAVMLVTAGVIEVALRGRRMRLGAEAACSG